jgi:hypothetical protein
MTTYAYRLPDGSKDTPDAQGCHTVTVNVLHSAEQYKRFPGCEECRCIAASSCPVCFNIPATSTFAGYDERTDRFASSVHHSPDGCGDKSCRLCAKYAAGWCQTCAAFTRPTLVPTVTVTCKRKRYTLTFSKLAGEKFGPYGFAEAIGQLRVAALLSPLDARDLVMDAAAADDGTAVSLTG